MKLIAYSILLILLALTMSACVTSYSHPPVTTETDKAISTMMAPIR